MWRLKTPSSNTKAPSRSRYRPGLPSIRIWDASRGAFQRTFDELLAAEAVRQLMLEAADYIGQVYISRDSGKPRSLRCPELRDAVVPNDAIIGVRERLLDLADEYAAQRKELENCFAARVSGDQGTRRREVARPAKVPEKTLLKAAG